eukprot:PITA_07945
MELYARRLHASLDRTLFFVILTACCASLFPCYLCLDLQYQYCRNTRRCGVTNISYPLGVGKHGCGHPNFQIDCVQNLTPVITIQGQKYTILYFYHRSKIFSIVRGEKCKFLEDPIDMEIPYPRRTDTTKIIGRENRTLYVYKCNMQSQMNYTTMLHRKCNSSVYYNLFDRGSSIPGCFKTQVMVDVLLLGYNDTKRDESCSSCHQSQGICGYRYNTSDSTVPFVCYCKDGPRTDNCHNHGCVVGGAALLAVLSLTYHLKNRKPPPGEALPRHLPGREMGNLPIFSYEALRQSTNGFHEENELGVGGFGSVYIGKLWDGRIVAVKRLYQDNSRRLDQFINEVHIFSILNHPHVVRLYGCTPADSPELLLVYELVPNGTLADHLHGDRKKPEGLPWNTRLNIAIQTAQALAFLHALDPPLIHRDVKSSNILLDENLDTKLADFGLCRLVPVDASHVTTIPQGTPGYVDPEYYQCYQLTEKSDVYSFGVVLMEIVSAKIAMDINRNRREINLANLAITKIQGGALDELVDPQLEIEVNHEVKVMARAVAELALRCLASEKDDRPDMEKIVAELEKIRRSSVTSTGAGGEQWRSFSMINQQNTAPLSLSSVQDKCPRISSTPNISTSTFPCSLICNFRLYAYTL